MVVPVQVQIQINQTIRSPGAIVNITAPSEDIVKKSMKLNGEYTDMETAYNSMVCQKYLEFVAAGDDPCVLAVPNNFGDGKPK